MDSQINNSGHGPKRNDQYRCLYCTASFSKILCPEIIACMEDHDPTIMLCGHCGELSFVEKRNGIVSITKSSPAELLKYMRTNPINYQKALTRSEYIKDQLKRVPLNGYCPSCRQPVLVRINEEVMKQGADLPFICRNCEKPGYVHLETDGKTFGFVSVTDERLKEFENTEPLIYKFYMNKLQEIQKIKIQSN